MNLALPPAGTLKPNDQHDPLPYYYRPLLGWLYRKRLRMGLDLLPAKASRILEVGVGSGILVPTLSSNFSHYTGIDLVLADGLDRLVAPSCRAEFLQADLLRESDLPEGSFDAVVCLSVLEHIADAEAAAAEDAFFAVAHDRRARQFDRRPFSASLEMPCANAHCDRS